MIKIFDRYGPITIFLFALTPLPDDLSDMEIELSGISKLEIAHLAEIILGAPASPDLMTLVMSRSEGNPYFSQQIIRYLQEEQPCASP